MHVSPSEFMYELYEFIPKFIYEEILQCTSLRAGNDYQSWVDCKKGALLLCMSLRHNFLQRDQIQIDFRFLKSSHDYTKWFTILFITLNSQIEFWWIHLWIHIMIQFHGHEFNSLNSLMNIYIYIWFLTYMISDIWFQDILHVMIS